MAGAAHKLLPTAPILTLWYTSPLQLPDPVLARSHDMSCSLSPEQGMRVASGTERATAGRGHPVVYVPPAMVTSKVAA